MRVTGKSVISVGVGGCRTGVRIANERRKTASKSLVPILYMAVMIVDIDQDLFRAPRLLPRSPAAATFSSLLYRHKHRPYHPGETLIAGATSSLPVGADPPPPTRRRADLPPLPNSNCRCHSLLSPLSPYSDLSPLSPHRPLLSLSHRDAANASRRPSVIPPLRTGMALSCFPRLPSLLDSIPSNADLAAQHRTPIPSAVLSLRRRRGSPAMLAPAFRSTPPRRSPLCRRPRSAITHKSSSKIRCPSSTTSSLPSPTSLPSTSVTGRHPLVSRLPCVVFAPVCLC
ncbi:hypothetical protein DAI22_12g104550 [Oryza sativa Japonica Group]|nr:hypothetical protein DAI22_12g104550 [Oryza sativa Japonica Group]